MTVLNKSSNTIIKIPKNCPCCESVLEKRNDILYCTNPSCSAKDSKKVEHFCKTLNIKGLGPATIEKLEISKIEEIYELDLNTIIFLLGSEKIANKLVLEINKSTKYPANKILPAFGIPLVGKSATEKLSLVCDSLFDINEVYCKKAGLGAKVTSNLLNWINTEFEKYCNLPLNFEFEKPLIKKPKANVCITGKLKTFKSKAEATRVLENKGYTVKSSLTNDVTILINESGIESTKTQSAFKKGIKILTNINDLIGE